MNGRQLEEEFSIQRNIRTSDTVVELVYEAAVQRRESTSQMMSTAEPVEVLPAPEGESRHKSRYKPRPKRSPKPVSEQTHALARATKSSITARAAQPMPAPESSLERHQRKCEICAHPDREAIEEAFFHWHSPLRTSIHCDVSLRALFRHAHATGLYAQRQGNIRSVLDRILERAEEATVTSESVIRAVRAYTCLTPANTWVEPASSVIFSTAPAPASALGPASGSTVRELASRGLEVPQNSQNLIDTPAIRK